MFAYDPEQFELLITRHLDGRLSAEEELEFQRLLIRAPEARRALEAYERLDAVAGEALREALPVAEPTFDPVELVKARRGAAAAHRHYHRAWWLLPTAAAACLLLAITTQTYWQAEQPASPAVNHLVKGPEPSGQPFEALPAQAGSGRLDSRPDVMPAAAPRRTLRHTDRQLIAIEGKDGQIYWLELDQTRTLRGQSARGNTRLTSGGV